MSISTKNIKSVLEQFGTRVVKAARLNLGATRTITFNDGKKRRRRQVSSGKLKDSLDFELLVKQNRNTKGHFQSGFNYEMSFEMLDYGQFIDEGVDGVKYKVQGGSRFGFTNKYPNMGAIKKMVEAPQFKIRDFKTGSFLPKNKTTIKNATFLISRSIYRKGIPKSNFFTTPFALEFEKLPLELLKGLDADLDNILADL